jgi:hypothetical protein
MALETLKGVTEIGGFKVIETNWKHPSPSYIEVNHVTNSILFKIQNGPIKENGVNGCQVDTLIHAALQIIGKLNAKYPCRENARACAYLTHAVDELKNRTKDREARGVEGTSNE